MYHCFQQKLTIFPCSRFRTRGLTGQLASLSSRHGRASLRVFLAGGRPCAALSLPPDPQTRVCLSTPLNDGRWHLLRVYRYFDRFFLVLIKYLFILNCRHVSSFRDSSVQSDTCLQVCIFVFVLLTDFNCQALI